MNGYRQSLRWAALPITDRRWAAPLSAVALGFGLFAGVAIGPGAAGTFATGAAQIIEIPGFGGGADTAAARPPPAESTADVVPGGGRSSIEASESTLPSLASSASGGPGLAEPAGPEPPVSLPSPENSGPDLALANAVPVGWPDAPTESECADMATILWQIYADDSSALLFHDAAALREWICGATPARASLRPSR